jgi:hypothetical protein
MPMPRHFLLACGLPERHAMLGGPKTRPSRGLPERRGMLGGPKTRPSRIWLEHEDMQRAEQYDPWVQPLACRLTSNATARPAGRERDTAVARRMKERATSHGGWRDLPYLRSSRMGPEKACGMLADRPHQAPVARGGKANRLQTYTYRCQLPTSMLVLGRHAPSTWAVASCTFCPEPMRPLRAALC